MRSERCFWTGAAAAAAGPVPRLTGRVIGRGAGSRLADAGGFGGVAGGVLGSDAG